MRCVIRSPFGTFSLPTSSTAAPFAFLPPSALQYTHSKQGLEPFLGSLAAHSGVWKTFFIFHFPIFFNLLQNTKNVTCEYEFVVVFCSRFVVVVVTALSRLPAATVVVVALLSAVKLKRAPTAENKLTLNVKFIEIVYVGAAIVLLLLLLLFFSCCCYCCFLVVVYRMAFEHILQAIGKRFFHLFSLTFLQRKFSAPNTAKTFAALSRPTAVECSEACRGVCPLSTYLLLSPTCLPVRLGHPNGLCGPVRVRVSPQLRFLFALLE